MSQPPNASKRDNDKFEIAGNHLAEELVDDVMAAPETQLEYEMLYELGQRFKHQVTKNKLNSYEFMENLYEECLLYKDHFDKEKGQ